VIDPAQFVLAELVIVFRRLRSQSKKRLRSHPVGDPVGSTKLPLKAQ
jgi:hypothetical protein